MAISRISASRLKNHRAWLKTKPINIIFKLVDYASIFEELTRTIWAVGRRWNPPASERNGGPFFLGSLTKQLILNFRWPTHTLTVNWFLAILWGNPSIYIYIYILFLSRWGWEYSQCCCAVFSTQQLSSNINFLIIAVALNHLDFQAIPPSLEILNTSLTFGDSSLRKLAVNFPPVKHFLR